MNPLFCAVVVLLPVPPLSGQTSASPQPPPAASAGEDRLWTITPHWTPGQTTRYQTQTSFDVIFHSDDKAKPESTFQFGTDATLRYSVKKIEAEARLLLSVVSEGGRITDISGQEREVPTEPLSYPRMVMLNRWGTLEKLEDLGGKAANPLESVFDLTNFLVPLHFLSFPDRAVKAGDSWTARYPLPVKGKPGDDKGSAKEKEKSLPESALMIEAKYTLVGAAKLGELNTLKITQEAAIPYSAMTDSLGGLTTDPAKKAGRLTLTLTFKMTAYVLPETGQVLQTSGVAEGELLLEGTLAAQLPGEKMRLEGKIIALRLANLPSKTDKK